MSLQVSKRTWCVHEEGVVTDLPGPHSNEPSERRYITIGYRLVWMREHNYCLGGHVQVKRKIAWWRFHEILWGLVNYQRIGFPGEDAWCHRCVVQTSFEAGGYIIPGWVQKEVREWIWFSTMLHRHASDVTPSRIGWNGIDVTTVARYVSGSQPWDRKLNFRNEEFSS